ncbi:hypothetical protein QTG54_002062 [Skeletonema marinoi]|uniref:Uncharacterized protein n=1 Tax=Skeletonema marinoi TaxID=267567 RepID=A0AAD8YIP9_9STRA|nr:hypothetical protein QTG54_002062 [Skeletonema marinoi]
MKLSLISFLAATGYATAASSNPFAPKVSANTAASAYTAKLVRGAKVMRSLEGGDDGEIDLTNYSIKFEKCQFVKEFAGEEGGGEDGQFLQTKRFIIFRLCPNNSCGSCNYDFGEYLVDLETYLQATTNSSRRSKRPCAYNNDGGDDNNGDNQNDCSSIDFIECQALENNNNNNNGVAYYAGAMCASSGSRIKIGVFTDEDCSILAENMDVESMLYGDNGAMKLSYHKIKSVFPESDCVASCLQEEEQDENNDGNNDQAAETAEICQTLYEAAGKCESIHGFSAMKYYNNNNGQGNYYNQVRNEEAVCNYMSNVMSGIYDTSGEISISGGRSITGGGAATTGGQKFALTFFILGSVGLAGYAAMLHQQLTKGAKSTLAQQGGAMA